MKKLIKNFGFKIILLTAVFNMSCVGTIKDANPILTKATSSKDTSIQDYPGISNVKAISDSRVEVFFPPIAGDSDEISYVIRYGGQLLSTYIQASSLRPDFRGMLKVTISSLQADSTYDFNIQARNVTTGAESTNASSKTARTFSNATARFTGITQVRNLSGANGLNGIEVFWNEAEVRGGIVTKDEIDPIEYKVTVIDATSLNPGNMNDVNFSEPFRKVFSAAPDKRSIVVNGLNQGTKYYVQVRAIHHGFSLNSSDAAYKLEENTNYLEISTYTEDLANLNFDIASFVTTFPVGASGLYSLIANWVSPNGNFDHYRLYYAVNGVANVTTFLGSAITNSFCFGSETDDANVKCEYVDFTKKNYTLTGLLPNTKYDLVLAVCLTADCPRSKRTLSILRNHITTPSVATFTGISSIDTAKTLGDLNKLFLNIPLPDFTSGNISGLLVDYYGSDPTNPSPVPLNNSDEANTSELTVDIFDYMTDRTIAISGVDPTAAVPYCFMVYPFTYNNDGSKNLFKTGLTPRCQVPAIIGPKATAFTGVTNVTCDTAAREANVDWTRPTTGIFNKYEFYYSKNNPFFSFGTAIDPASTGYTKIIVDGTQTSTTLTDLEPGATYRFGVLTMYQSIDGIVRSEFNTSIGQCAF